MKKIKKKLKKKVFIINFFIILSLTYLRIIINNVSEKFELDYNKYMQNIN